MTSLTLPMTSFSGSPPPLFNHRSKPHPSSSFISITNTAIKRTKIYSHNPNTSSKTLTNSKPLLTGKKLSLSCAAVIFLGIAGGAASGVRGGGGDGGGSGGGGGGNGGGGGGGGGGFWSSLFSRTAKAEEDESREYDSHGLPVDVVVQLDELNDFKRYKLSEVIFFDESSKKVVGLDDFLSESFPIKTNGVYTKAQIMKGLETFASTGILESLDLTAKTKPDGTISVKLSFLESTFPKADRFKCISVGLLPELGDIEIDESMSEKEKSEYNRMHDSEYMKYIKKSKACILSSDVEKEIMKMMSEQDKVNSKLFLRIRDRVEKWYHDKGYVLAQVVNFGSLDKKEVVCAVAEGDITDIVGQFHDKFGNVCKGKTQLGLIQRQFPDQLLPGNIFNIEAQRQAIRNLDSLSLFSNIEVHPLPDDEQKGGVLVGIRLKEDKQTKAGGFAKLPIAWRGFLPTPDSILPGGNFSFVYRNIEGLNRSIIGSVVTSCILNPQDDLAFKLEYVHPYLDGVSNFRNRTLRTSYSTKRKLNPVFTGRPGVGLVPPIYVDRNVIEANIAENITNESELTYGIVMEEITTRDRSGNIVLYGLRALPYGGIISDRKACLQAKMTRDNTKSVNGEIVGDRNVFQIEQGVGIGSSYPIFNRHQLTMTKFIQLKNVEEGVGKRPPPTLVLHTHYGGCAGDVASYDAFTLGGPYSVRGYNTGEIGDGRKKLEVAAELRVPVVNTPVGNTVVYAFAEHGNDLRSSEDANANQRKGHGSSYGAGLKLGQLRAEYVVNHNSGTGGLMFGFGDRF